MADRRLTGRALHGFAVFTALATLLLIFAGGMVTSTRSGLSVPDWPLSYGMLWPPMVGGVFYEHGHRAVAGTVGMLIGTLAVWMTLAEPRPWVRRLALAAAGLVLAQAILGGLTVIFLLPHAISVTHACLAQAILCLVVTIALVTSPAWARIEPGQGDPGDGTRRMAAVTAGAIYLQLFVGAVMRHLAKKAMDHDGPALAIPDFPLAFGHVVPPLDKLARLDVAVHFLHRLGAVAVAALVLATAIPVARRHRGRRDLFVPAVAMLATLPVQIGLGAIVIWSGKMPVPTTFHVTTGALLLAETVSLAVFAFGRRPLSARLVPALQAASAA